MKVLVLGGTGILGRDLVPTLVHNGHDVWVLSDGKGQFPVSQGVAQHLIADRNDEGQLLHTLSRATINYWDACVDLVCYNSLQATLLDKCIGRRCHRFIVASTTFVYEANGAFPLNENSPTGDIKQLGGYARNKLAMENAWRLSHRDTIILRIPHVIAPGCLPGAVPLHSRDTLLLYRLRRRWPVWLVQGGNQLLNFVHGSDVAAAISKLVGSHNIPAQTLNIAYPIPTTGLDYVTTLADILGLAADVRNVPLELFLQSDWGWELSSVSRLCDVSLLSSLVGAPSINLKQSLMNCLPSWEVRDNEELVDPLSALSEVDLRDTTVSLPTLQTLAKQRFRSGIDSRMNQKPAPAFLNKIKLLGT